MIHYNDSDYLCHYGVPGMKWGVKKSTLRQMSKSDRYLQKQKYKTNLKKNREQYRTARRKANKQFDRDTKEYSNAQSKLNRKFDKDQHKADKKYNQIDDFTSAIGLGKTTGYARQTTSNQIAAKRAIAQEALDTKYSDMIDKAYSKRSKSIKKAKNIYKENKNKIMSGTY